MYRKYVSIALLGVLPGCVLAPREMPREEARLKQAGAAYEAPIEKRNIPDLPAEPTWHDVLQRAFLANGDLESAYFQWKAAMARVDMAAAWPNTNLSVSFQYMFSREKMKSWDRTTVLFQPDAMANLTAPIKARQAGRVAFEAARAAGERFAAKKFEIQRQVLAAWLDYALMAEEIRIQSDNVALLKMLSETAAERVRGGAPQQDLLKAQIEYRMAENELGAMRAKADAMRAMLNGMLGRAAEAALKAPNALPASRALEMDDARLIAAATDRNPELAALAREVAGRKDALQLAKMAYIPDINPMAGFTGDISKMVGAMISVPTTIPMIEGQIREAQAMLRESQAMLRQTQNDRGASFVAALYALRSDERQERVFRDGILPMAEQVLRSSRQAYAAGSINLIEMIDSQRTLLQVRRMIAETHVEREKRLVEMEALAGVDIETLNQGKRP